MANWLSKFVILIWFFVVFFTGGCGDVDTELSSITVSPSAPTVGINQSQLFSVTARNSVGAIVSVEPTWSLSGSAGSIASTGLFTAGASSGEATVIATYGTLSDEAAVTVTELGWILGKVTDSQGSKVSNLKVYLEEDSSLFDLTDSDGDYSIASVPAGTYKVFTTITQAYQATSQEVAVASGESTRANFTIQFFTDPPDLNAPEFEI